MSDLNLSMFRAYDIRTPSELLTDSLASRLARAEAAYFLNTLQAVSVVVAHDARSSGPRYLEIATVEYTRSGLDVIVIPGVCSTSQFYFAAMRHPGMAAVMFGASHNPAGDTGRKILGPGVRPIAEGIGPEGGLNRIMELYVKGTTADAGSGRVSAYDPTEEYIRYSMEMAGVKEGDLAGVQVLQDYLNGAAGREMMIAFDRAGADLTPLHFAADGRFPLGDPNPVKQAVIQPGIERLKSGGNLCGFFFDGDGDRIDVYRGDGAYLSSSFVYAGILPAIRGRFPQGGLGVYADLKSNPLAVMEMARAGFTVKVIRNGHSQIKNALFEDLSTIGCVEESAHFYESFPAPDALTSARYATENTLYVALLLTKQWHENPSRFDRLFEIQAGTSREREWGYKFSDDSLRQGALEATQVHFESKGLLAKSRMDNGYDLEATLMRRGIPFDIDEHTRMESDWIQVCQRTSQSESGLARWEVVATDSGLATEAREEIGRIVQQFGAGDEYQG